MKDNMMGTNSTFDEVLDAVEHLPLDAQADLVAVVQRRLAEEGRRRVVADVQQGRPDFQNGNIVAAAAEDLIREIDS